jgi:hypothetical protein
LLSNTRCLTVITTKSETPFSKYEQQQKMCRTLKEILGRNYLVSNVSICIPLADIYYTETFIAYQVLVANAEEERPLETPRSGQSVLLRLSYRTGKRVCD